MLNYLYKNLIKINSIVATNRFEFIKRKIHASKSPLKRKRSTTKMHRHWEPALAEQQRHGETYKLMSYNILAQDLLEEHIYLYCDIDTQLLRWSHRLAKLREEIMHLNPDILCLQEIQCNHLKQFVNEIRGCRKMEYIYKKKTGFRTDGCAIIYDRNKFKMVEERGIEYYKAGIHTLNRENIALMAKFHLVGDPGRTVVVATTHLLYNPKRSDVRLAQVEVLLDALDKFSQPVAGGTALPVLLTGDFNFESHSTPYAVLTGLMSPRHDQQNGAQCSHDQEGAANAEASNSNSNNSDASQSQANSPACSNHDAEPHSSSQHKNQLKMCAVNFGDYSASTHQYRWITVDYILYSIDKCRNNIKIWSVLQLPTYYDCRQIGKIPNHITGSDHYSLAVQFSVS